MGQKRYKIEAQCPACGCGLMENMATDVYQEKYGFGYKKEIEITCPDCGKKHKAVVIEEEDK